jgi:hypothetical protein
MKRQTGFMECLFLKNDTEKETTEIISQRRRSYWQMRRNRNQESLIGW